MDSGTSLLTLLLLMIVNMTILAARENLSKGVQPKGSRFVFWTGIGALVAYLVSGGLVLFGSLALLAISTQAALASAKHKYEQSIRRSEDQ